MRGIIDLDTMAILSHNVFGGHDKSFGFFIGMDHWRIPSRGMRCNGDCVLLAHIVLQSDIVFIDLFLSTYK